MCRTFLLLAGVLLSVVALGSDSPKEYDDTTIQTDDLQGEWNTDEGIIRSFRSGERTWAFSYLNLQRSGNYKTDTRYNPPRLEMTEKASGEVRIRKYIYQIDGDTLRIGCLSNNSLYPKNFDEEGVFLGIYNRVKK